MIGIYKITNPHNKVYVGQSVNIENRKRYYKNEKNCKNQIKLSRSIKKYGLENHLFETLEECSIDNLNEKERFWQDFYDCLNNGLNCRLTLTTDKSGVLSDETKLKIGNSNRGKHHTEETKNKLRKNRLGKISSQHTKDKVSKNHGRWNAKLSNEQVHDICKMYLSGKTSREVIEKYPKIHRCTLCEIRNKKIYRDVTNQYDIKKPSKKGGKRKTQRIVLCVEDNIKFEGLQPVSNFYKIKISTICEAIRNKRKVKSINKKFLYV